MAVRRVRELKSNDDTAGSRAVLLRFKLVMHVFNDRARESIIYSSSLEYNTAAEGPTQFGGNVNDLSGIFHPKLTQTSESWADIHAYNVCVLELNSCSCTNTPFMDSFVVLLVKSISNPRQSPDFQLTSAMDSFAHRQNNRRLPSHPHECKSSPHPSPLYESCCWKSDVQNPN